MIFNRTSSVLLDIKESPPCLALDALLCTFKNCCVRKNLTTTNYLLLVRLAAAPSSDGHRLAVLVEASSTAVNVGVGGGCHWLLPRPDGFGWAEEGDKLPLEDDRLLYDRQPIRQKLQWSQNSRNAPRPGIRWMWIILNCQSYKANLRELQGEKQRHKPGSH